MKSFLLSLKHAYSGSDLSLQYWSLTFICRSAFIHSITVPDSLSRSEWDLLTTSCDLKQVWDDLSKHSKLQCRRKGEMLSFHFSTLKCKKAGRILWEAVLWDSNIQPCAEKQCICGIYCKYIYIIVHIHAFLNAYIFF